MITRRIWMLVALALGLGGLAGPAAAKNIDPPPGAWTAGNYPSNSSDYIGISGVSGQNDKKNGPRQYRVHVPKGYNGLSPTPVVFCYPGLGETVVMLCVNGTKTGSATGLFDNGNGPGIYDLSDVDGYVLVMMEGLHHSWNGGACCKPASSEGVDDVALTRAVYAVIQQHVNVDTTRIYATGLSNGAFMSDRLACEASDMFVAVFEASGGIQTTPMSACQPQYKVAVLGTHGIGGKDAYVPYQGDADSMNQFAAAEGCSSQTVPATRPLSVGDGTHDGDVTCTTHTGCPANTEVTFCSIQNGGHCWYGSPSCGTGFGTLAADIALEKGVNTTNIVDTNEMWPFFSKYHR